MTTSIERLTATASAQHGVVSLAQFRDAVPSTHERRRLVAAGWLEPVAPRAYALAGSPDTWERALHTGLASLGPEALVSHRAAAALHGFDRADREAVEFCLPRSGRGRSGALVVHTSGHLGPTDAVTVSGLRVTSATRTIIDLARLRVPPTELEAAIDSAVRMGLSSPVVIEHRLGEIRGRGRWGCRRLDELLVDSGGHTRLERMFLRLVRQWGLPRPRTQVVHRRGGRTVARVDFLFDPYPLVVEVSGQHGHSAPAERTADVQRRNELDEIGRQFVEFTWHHVDRQPGYVRTTLIERLRRCGWPAEPPSWSENSRPRAREI